MVSGGSDDNHNADVMKSRIAEHLTTIENQWMVGGHCSTGERFLVLVGFELQDWCGQRSRHRPGKARSNWKFSEKDSDAFGTRP